MKNTLTVIGTWTVAITVPICEPPEPPPFVPEASTLILFGGAATGLASYIGLQIRARRRK